MISKRFDKIKSVVEKRQKYLTVVLENIHDPHNVSAILRSADCVGIDKVFLIYNTNKFPRIGRHSSASAKKWMQLEKYRSVKECFDKLREEKFKIYSTYINGNKKNYSLYELDLTRKVALVFGNEHEGVSNDVKKYADKNFVIPMYGMVQSLNVSVAVAVCLYEALRQREIKGLYNTTKFARVEMKRKIQDYLNR